MSKLLRFFLTVTALCAIIYFVDLEELPRTFADANYLLLTLTLLIFSFDRVLMAYKWTLLLRPHAISLGIIDAWSIYSMTSFYGSFLPSTVGADALRVIVLRRRGVDTFAVSASVVIERISGFIVGSSLSVLALIYFSRRLNIQPTWSNSLMAIAGASVLAISIVLLIRFLHLRRPSMLPNRWVRCVRDILGKIQAAHRVYDTESVLLLKFFILTGAEQLLSLAMGYLLALSLNIDVNIFDFMAALAVGILLSRLPLTIDGFGIMEATVGGMLIWVGVSVSDSIIVVLIGRLMNILAFLPGTIVHSIREAAIHSDRVNVK